MFASNILLAADQAVSEWAKRGIAVVVITFATLLHTFFPKTGVRLMNLLGSIKVIVLLFIVVTGWVVLSGKVDNVPDPRASFRAPFAGSTTSSSQYATALFKVLNSFSGYV